MGYIEIKEALEMDLHIWLDKYQKACEDMHVADEMVHDLKKRLADVEKLKE